MSPTKSLVSTRLQAFIRANGGPVCIARETDISRSTILGWLYRGSLPDLATLVRLTQAYGRDKVLDELIPQ